MSRKEVINRCCFDIKGCKSHTRPGKPVSQRVDLTVWQAPKLKTIDDLSNNLTKFCLFVTK